MNVQCRLWWPKTLSSVKADCSMLLFGWFIRFSLASFDLVVANAYPIKQILLQKFDLQMYLHSINEQMPTDLQDKTMYCILGHYVTEDCCRKRHRDLVRIRTEDCFTEETNSYNNCTQNYQYLSGSSCSKNCTTWNCSSHRLDMLKQLAVGADIWIQLTLGSVGITMKEVDWIPKLDHVYLDGQLLSCCDLHIIIYELPVFGAHHFSLLSWNFTKVASVLERPKWVEELHRKQPVSDLVFYFVFILPSFFSFKLQKNVPGALIPSILYMLILVLAQSMVFLALNCAAAARIPLKVSQLTRQSHKWSLWSSVAAFVASVSTLLYLFLHLCNGFLIYVSQTLIYKGVKKVFSCTCKNMHIRSCQLLYWPVFFNVSCGRSKSNVEYAHKAALCRHSLWSSVAADILLGIVTCLPLLIYSEPVSNWLVFVAHGITDNVLRSCCIWLMGVPAGFKLNNELAEILGVVSLNAVQVWCTLWFLARFLLQYLIKGLAISGVLFGATVFSALCIDVIKLGMFHLFTLHWLISLLYSKQIQILSSLWRLFRGRKWNPLRQRLDSYDYTVEQHVLGSLLFTPVLLLLPTTSVFYIFLTIMKTTTSFVCIFIEILISFLHATPYAKIFLWIARQNMFPSGVWFENLLPPTSQRLGLNERWFMREHLDVLGPKDLHHQSDGVAVVLVSALRSNLAGLGEILLPHYRKVFHGISLLSIASSAYGIFSGRSMPSGVHILPPPLPWFYIHPRAYWRMCYEFVLPCGSEHCDVSLTSIPPAC